MREVNLDPTDPRGLCEHLGYVLWAQPEARSA